MMHRTARRRPALIAALALGVTSALADGVANAHFQLIAPANWMVQSADGSPQKTGPCGNEAPQTASNVITPYHPGDTVTFQLEETVFHPGHYRVALAVNSPSELPPEPTVTAGSTACGTVVIQQNPAFPILADGMLPHTQPFTAQQSFQVKLPTNVTCTACTLQIIEFMSSHGAPCFYHHCAKISIQDSTVDGGTGTADSGVDAARDSTGGTGGAAGSGNTGGGAGTAGGTGGSGGAGNTGGGAGSGGTTGGSGGTGATGGSAGSGATTGAGGAVSGGAAGQGGSTGSALETSGCNCSMARATGQSLTSTSALFALALVGLGRRRRLRY